MGGVELTRFRGQVRLWDEESPEGRSRTMEANKKVAARGPQGSRSRPTHAPYPPEFRAEAVRLVRAAGTSMRRVAKDLGVHEETLRLWVRQTDIDAGRRDGLTTG